MIPHQIGGRNSVSSGWLSPGSYMYQHFINDLSFQQNLRQGFQQIQVREQISWKAAVKSRNIFLH